MEAIPPVLARNVVAAWGADGRRFLDDLPALLDSVTQDWGLTVVAPLPMTYHWVGRVRQAGGGEAVLKLGPPQAVEVGSEAAALRHFAGAGAVRLLAADLARGALLLELATPGESARPLVPAKDLIATAAIITVMRRLHRPLPGSLPSVPELGVRNRRTFAAYLARHPGDSPLPRRLVTRALGLSDELCASAASRVVLHGDLHHDNVLRAARAPWLAIDPHGVVGDPGAEVGPMLYNPDPDNRDPALLALVPARLEQLADGLGMDPDRVAAWGFVGAVLSEVWTAEDPTAPTTRALDVALLLAQRIEAT
ncbi:MAG: phosphotransferase [Micromonosporaceae bacterium]|nr:phosphotransferase [Micromonosporaceae bacterium]